MFNQIPPHIVATHRLPLVIGMVTVIFILGILMVRSQMKQKTVPFSHEPHQSMDISLKTEGHDWFNEEKFKNVKINGPHKPTPREVQQQKIERQIIALQQQKTQEQEKEEQAAMRSPLSIDIPAAPGAPPMPVSKSTSNHEGLSGPINELMDMVKSVVGGKSLEADLNNNLDAKGAFLKQTRPQNNDYLEILKTKPRSIYEVKAGTYIPAVLITGINADLPGNANAQVSENVYDTRTGNYLLIPQGTRLVGEYNSQIAFGQDRVQVVWERLIFPDGESLDLNKMQGVDISGHTGFHDKVNNHYFRIYSNALLLSLMGAGYDLLNNQNQVSNGPLTVQQALASNIGQKMSEVANKSLEKNMDVQPTLVIESGYKFKIFVLKDIVLEEIRDVKTSLSYTE